MAVGLRLAVLSAGAFATVGLIYLLERPDGERATHRERALTAAAPASEAHTSTALLLLATISVWSLVAAILVVMLVALPHGRPRLALVAGRSSPCRS